MSRMVALAGTRAQALCAGGRRRAPFGSVPLQLRMAVRICYHCKQPVEDGAAHDCWTTTERALTRDLSDDLQEAWERLRETAAALGEQRIYASHKSIMFSRKSCYCFVRPKTKHLEVCLFLGRTLKAPQIRRSDRASTTKVAHLLHVRHRDEVEAPLTDWLREAYEYSGAAARPRPGSGPPTPRRKTAAQRRTGSVKAAKKKSRQRKK